MMPLMLSGCAVIIDIQQYSDAMEAPVRIMASKEPPLYQHLQRSYLR